MTDHCPPPELPGERATLDLVLAELRSLTGHVSDLRAEVSDIAADVRLARHALAVAADDVLERRKDVADVAERLDRLQAYGCSLGRTLHGRGNGHG